MTAYDRLLDALREAGRTVITKSSGGQATAQCPAHDDRNPSLSITKIESQALIHCHAGCAASDVVAALDLTMADLYDDGRGADYHYADGRIVHRSAGKRFRQSGNTTGTSLFRAEEVTPNVATVYVCEGEKDVLAIESVGGTAVCSAMGAGKAHLADWSALDRKHVVVVADKDKAGRKHAEMVVEHLDRALSVSVVESPVGKDAADHVAAGKGLDELVHAPWWTSPDRSKLWRATDLEPSAQPQYLAKDRIPRSAITVLIGDEGIGKSLFWVWIVAAVTTGKPLPEFGIPERDPAVVFIVITEDDWSTDVQPRLTMAGADLTNVRVICSGRDGSGAPTFPRDNPVILNTDEKPALIVVDAWLDTVAANLQVRDTQQARQALHPWKEIASATNAAVMLVAHSNRVASGNARDLVGATIALRAKARMMLWALRDQESGTIFIGPEKANGVATARASMFAITGAQCFAPTAEHDGTVPVLTCTGAADATIRQLLSDTHEATQGDDPQDKTDAEKWLQGYLEIEGPYALSRKAKSEAKNNGIAERTLQRARAKLNVVVGYVGNPPVSTWTLPEQVTHDSDDRIGESQDAGAPGSAGTAANGVTPLGQGAVPRRAADTPCHTDSDQNERHAVPADTQNERPTTGDGTPNESLCFHCRKPVTCNQRDEDGRAVHLSCQQEPAIDESNREEQQQISGIDTAIDTAITTADEKAARIARAKAIAERHDTAACVSSSDLAPPSS